MTENNISNIDDAISAYIKSEGDDGTFVTGWIIVASVSSPEHDATRSDGYVTASSDGLPHHTQVGLLTVALQDKQSISLFGSMSSVILNLTDDEDDEED